MRTIPSLHYLVSSVNAASPYPEQSCTLVCCMDTLEHCAKP